MQFLFTKCDACGCELNDVIPSEYCISFRHHNSVESSSLPTDLCKTCFKKIIDIFKFENSPIFKKFKPIIAHYDVMKIADQFEKLKK